MRPHLAYSVTLSWKRIDIGVHYCFRISDSLVKKKQKLQPVKRSRNFAHFLCRLLSLAPRHTTFPARTKHSPRGQPVNTFPFAMPASEKFATRREENGEKDGNFQFFGVLPLE